MMKMIVYTQVYENYGSASGPIWKTKGRKEYIIGRFACNDITSKCWAQRASVILMTASSIINKKNYKFNEHIIDWELLPNDHLTENECNQVESERKVQTPAEDISEKVKVKMGGN